MKTNLIRFAMVAAICSCVGCAMCCGPFDYDYPVYGGKHERSDQTYGRVGSVFTDPMANVGESADSNIKPVTKETKKQSEDKEDSDEAQRLKEKIDKKLDRQSDEFDKRKPEPETTKENNTAIGRPGNRINDAQWR